MIKIKTKSPNNSARKQMRDRSPFQKIAAAAATPPASAEAAAAKMLAASQGKI
jgi:hypothetical protein